jgi:predicted dehydrogenase
VGPCSGRHGEERHGHCLGSAGRRGPSARRHLVAARAAGPDVAGKRPAQEGETWGYDAPEHWGTLNTAAGSERVPSKQGAYQDYYARFAAALRGDGEFPVPAQQAVHTLEVLDAARASAEQNWVLELDPA